MWNVTSAPVRLSYLLLWPTVTCSSSLSQLCCALLSQIRPLVLWGYKQIICLLFNQTQCGVFGLVCQLYNLAPHWSMSPCVLNWQWKLFVSIVTPTQTIRSKIVVRHGGLRLSIHTKIFKSLIHFCVLCTCDISPLEFVSWHQSHFQKTTCEWSF